ncbi:hypothetical protein [Francisella noatunensis]|nr:hypothetical protein [Francisella noatunensis]
MAFFSSLSFILVSSKPNKLYLELSFNYLKLSEYNLASIKYNNEEFLITDNSNAKDQQQIYTLYNRIINPSIVISPLVIDTKFFKPSSEYLIYISDQLLNPQAYKNTNIRVFDTYANGAITITVDNDGTLKIRSLFKKY